MTSPARYNPFSSQKILTSVLKSPGTAPTHAFAVAELKLTTPAPSHSPSEIFPSIVGVPRGTSTFPTALIAETEDANSAQIAVEATILVKKLGFFMINTFLL